MKFKITFKDPDGFDDSVMAAARESFTNLPLEDEELDVVEKIRAEKFKSFTERWVKYSELITIEFDTEANTATVIPCDP